MTAPKVLHLLSNWKWTEVSEPAVDLALAQQKLGAEVAFVCGRGPADRALNCVAHQTRQKGLNNAYVLEMPKHFRLSSAYKDWRGLRSILNGFKPDVIHCHKSNAHLMGFLCNGGRSRPIIVRSCYDPEGLPTDFRSRFLYARATHGLMVISDTSRRMAIARNSFSNEAVAVVEPGIDLDRFSPQRRLSEDPQHFGLGHDAFVVGVVSRIRESRRLDIPLQALHALSGKYPQLKLLVIGRGRKKAVEATVKKPAREKGILDRIVMGGYCTGDRLVAAYRAMNVLVYPFPGTDKSCRTVREAMAAGLPVIAPRIGFLPELIEDHVTGRLMASSGHNLAAILEEMIADDAMLSKMASQCIETSARRFSLKCQGEKTLHFYETLLRSV
jgi:glycosyltransferase involved in cell wall biosynthesis